MRATPIFLWSLFWALFIQGVYWHVFVSLDQSEWIASTQQLAILSPDMFRAFTYGYPGGPPMLLAIGAHTFFGISFDRAFAGSLGLLISLATATSAWLGKVLRPQLLWWVGILITLSANSLYIDATPPSAVIIPFLVLIFLIVFYIYERRAVRQRWPFILLGAVVGVAAATRLDIAMFLAVSQGLFLWPVIGWRLVMYTTLVAFFFFLLTNPFMWFFPRHFLRAFYFKIIYHYHSYDAKLNIIEFVKKSPFAWLGIVYGSVFITSRTTRWYVPPLFILNLLAVTGVYGTILLFSAYQPLWYFSPFIVLWEVFFLLFTFELLARVSFSFRWPWFGWSSNRVLQIGVVFLVIAGRITLLVLLYRFPAYFLV